MLLVINIIMEVKRMSNSAIIDLSWFGTNNPNAESWRDSLTNLSVLGDASIAKAKRHSLARSLITDGTYSRQLYLLERLFEFDSIFLDGIAIRLQASYRIPEQLENCFELVEPDKEVYQSAVADLNSNLELLPEDVRKELDTLKYWEKTAYHDDIFKHIGKIPPIIAGSYTFNDIPRAFFYLALAKAISAVPLMTGSKARAIQSMGVMIPQSQHGFVKSVLDAAFVEGIKSRPESNDIWRISETICPPIIEYLLFRAVEEDQPFVDLLLRLRDTTHARDYRKKMSELRLCAENARFSREDVAKISKTTEELSKLALGWAESFDYDRGVNYVPRKLNLSKLPLIGKWLALAGMEKLEIKDLLVSGPPGYLIFCANWYNPRLEFGHSDLVS